MVWKGTPSGDYLAPCLVKLIDEVDARAPKRNRESDGSLGDRAHASRTSDHNPDSTGCVCALDVTDDPAHFDPDDFCEILRQRRDRRIKYMISDRRICASYATSSRPAWTWGPYSGSNPHDRHAHISVLRERADDTTTWFPQEDDEVTPEDIEKIAERVWQRPIKDSRAGVNMNASPTLVLGEMFMRLRQLSAAAGKSHDFDEAAIAREILEHLDAEAIAAAIPKAVADEVARRLAG